VIDILRLNNYWLAEIVDCVVTIYRSILIRKYNKGLWMKRRNFIKAAVTGLAIAPVANIVSAKAGNKKLRMQTCWGEQADPLFKVFTSDVSNASDKSLTIDQFASSALVPDAELLQAVGKGALDMCQGYAGYWPEQLDIATIESGVLGAWASYDEAMYVMESQGLAKLIRQAYAEKNVHYLGAIVGGSCDLLTKKPVNSLDDLKRMKIRATPNVAKILEKFGITTISIPSSQLYRALSTGLIDGVIYAGANEYLAMKLNEVAKHYTALKMISPSFTDQMLINMDTWQSLTSAQQAVIETSFAKHARNMHTSMVNGAIDASNSGVFELNTLNETDTARLLVATQELWQQEALKSQRNKKAINILIAAANVIGSA